MRSRRRRRADVATRARQTGVMEQQEWIKNVIYFQAWCRGFLIRKELRTVQVEYEDIVKELEGSLEHLAWSGQFIPKPHFTDQESTLRDLHPKVQYPVKLMEQSGESEKSLPNSTTLVAERDDEPNDGVCRQATTPPGAAREVEELQSETPGESSSGALERSYSSLMEKGHLTRSLLKDVENSPESLRQHRRTLAMELLWIQQAIASRKKYLTLKKKMEVA